MKKLLGFICICLISITTLAQPQMTVSTKWLDTTEVNWAAYRYQNILVTLSPEGFKGRAISDGKIVWKYNFPSDFGMITAINQSESTICFSTYYCIDKKTNHHSSLIMLNMSTGNEQKRIVAKDSIFWQGLCLSPSIVYTQIITPDDWWTMKELNDDENIEVDESFLAGYDRTTMVRKFLQADFDNSPNLLGVFDGKLLATIQNKDVENKIAAFDPSNGERLWKATTGRIISGFVEKGNLYVQPAMVDETATLAAVQISNGDVLWSNNGKSFLDPNKVRVTGQNMAFTDNYIIDLGEFSHNTFFSIYNKKDGDKLWKQVLVNGSIRIGNVLGGIAERFGAKIGLQPLSVLVSGFGTGLQSLSSLQSLLVESNSLYFSVLDGKDAIFSKYELSAEEKDPSWVKKIENVGEMFRFIPNTINGYPILIGSKDIGIIAPKDGSYKIYNDLLPYEDQIINIFQDGTQVCLVFQHTLICADIVTK